MIKFVTNYNSLPLEHFAPMVKRIFSRKTIHFLNYKSLSEYSKHEKSPLPQTT